LTRPTILIAGGGTGGHVFPGVAVAEAAQSLADVDVVFVGTARGVESRVIPARGWRLELLDVEPMKGGGASRAVRGAAIATAATVSAAGLVRRLRPRAVLSVGGYASGPAALAAVLLGIPVAVLEPNSRVGLANRLLAPFARCAFLAWDEASGPFRARTVRQYGVPLRAGFAPRAYPAPGDAEPAARVLVLGGSQGAAVLNERLPEAIGRLMRERRSAEAASPGRPSVPQTTPAIRVLHQAGRDRDAPVRDAYAAAGVQGARVVPFIDDVAQALADADLVVGRAGAGAIAEITAIGRPSLLVPFPHAADDHQGANADALERAGAAVCLRQENADVPSLAAAIGRLLADEAGRRAMAEAARSRGRPDAARYVARDLLALARIAEREPARLRANGAEHARPSAGRWN
jgi:UDP-N-acetylglucosamine--N-acetylmuramyl-(pentapeptide) pyrophosphoryl-undecaprenol N-acetylglucosamine transferase